jgi:DNA replication protein DnaC
MPSLLTEKRQENIPEPDEFSQKEVPCKNKCGGTTMAEWHVPTKQWVYAWSNICTDCHAAQEQSRRRGTYLASAGLTEYEGTVSLDGFIETPLNREALQATKRFIQGDSINLFLYGKAGRGKTRLALAAINARLDAKSKFLPLTRFLIDVRTTKDGEDYWLKKITDASTVVLDDFGSQKLTEWSLAFMDCVVDEWYRHRKKRLIVTSNFNLAQISENMSDRIASRFKAMCEIHEVGGKDNRIEPKTP